MGFFEYVGYFDQNIQKIPSFDGFDLLLTSQFNVNFVNKENLDWLIDILNPNQYSKNKASWRETDILYKKDGKMYMEQDTKTDSWCLDYELIYSVFLLKFGHNYRLFKELTKGILLNTYKCKVKTTTSISINYKI